MSSHLSDDLQEQYEDFRMLVRKATKESLDEPDWAVNTECVNLVKPITDPDLLYEIAQLLMRRLREGNIRIVVLTLYLIDALAHHCGHALLLTFNDEQFMQQIASVARKYHLSPSQRAISMTENHPERTEAVSVCVELLNNWSEFFRARRAYYSNIVDMAEILESEGIGKPGNVRASSPSSPSVAASQGYTTLASGADQSRRTQQVSPQLTAHNTTSSGNMLSDNSLTTNDKSMMYPTTTTNNTTGANNNPLPAPLTSIDEHSQSQPQSPAKPQLTTATTMPISYGSPPKHNNTFKSEHPWFSREERGMQSKSDYSKTTLDSHEPRDRLDSEDFNNINVAPYSPERAEAKNKNVGNTSTTPQEHKNSSFKLSVPTNTTTSSNTATAIFSPIKTVTKTGSGDHTQSDEDFGVGGDLWDDSMELTSPTTTIGKGLRINTSDKVPDKPSYVTLGSPQKPAQKALQEFLECNTIDDRELQDELLNQVEIEKRIQENNRSKQNNLNNTTSNSVHKNHTSTHHSTQQQSTRTTHNTQNTNQNMPMVKNTNYTPMNTPKNTANITNASTLQHELTHQHEIERSIREQMTNKQHSNNANNYNSSAYSNTNTKTHYSKTTNSKVNANIHSTTKSPILEDIRNFQYSFDSNEQIMYNADIMHSQSYDNAQVPPRSPHKREQGPGLHYQPISAVSNSNNNLGSDSDDNYDGNVVDYADGTNQDFFFVPSTNTYIDTMERKNHHNRPHTGSISSNDYFTGGGSVGGMSNVHSVHRNHGTNLNHSTMGTMGMGHPMHPMHPGALNPINPNMNNAMNMYNLPGEFVSLTTTQYNFTKVPSFYSGMNMNVPAITNMPMSTSPNYYGGSSVHSPQPYGYTNSTIASPPNATTAVKDSIPLLNTQSNNSLLLDQQIEQQKLILQEFERQKQLLLLQQQQQQQQNRQSPVHMQATAASPRSTYSASPLPNSPDLQQEVNLAKEKLLRQQQTILASAPVVSNNHVQSVQSATQSAMKGDSAVGVGESAQNNKQDETKSPPPVQPVPGATSSVQRPRGVDNLTLRTSNTVDGNNAGNTSVYGNNNSVSGASNNGFNSIPSRKYSYGGGETLAANRAAAGTPHSFAHTNDSLNPSLHAQRREKERREQRKREIESEWAREQERAMEHTTEHVRPIANTNNTNNTTNSPLPGNSGSNVHTSRGGKRLNITTSTSIISNYNNYELDDASVVSDLTSSTISSTSRTLYSKIDAEPVAPPLSRSDSDIIRSMYVENHLSTSILPLRGSSNKLNAESSNNLSSQNLSSNNTNTNTSTGVNTEDPVFQSVAKMLKQALDPTDGTQKANPNNTCMSGGTIDRAKALAAAQLLIATLTGAPAVTTTNESNNVAYEGMIDKSSSHESSRPYALSIDVSDIAVARTPRNSYKQKTSGNTNTNTSTMSPKMEQYTSTRHRDVTPAIPSVQGIYPTNSVELPMTSSGSAAGMPPRSPVKPTAIRSTSERYIVPDVISNQLPIQEEKFSPPRKSDSASNSPVDIAVYPTTTLTRNTVALQSGISVITDDDSYFTKERPNTQSTYNNLTSSHHHNAHERGRHRHRPPLNVGIGGIVDPVSDTGKPVSSNRHSQRGLHRSASMEPSPRHSNSHSHSPTDFNVNTNTVTNTHSSNSAGKLSNVTDTTTRRLHRSASLEPSRSPRHSSRDSNKALDDDVWRVDSPKESAAMGYDRGSSSELHLSDPTSPLTEASGSPRYTTNSVPRDNKDNASTAFSHNEASRHSKQSAFDSAGDSQANFVANAILQHRNKAPYRGNPSRSAERDRTSTTHYKGNQNGTSHGIDTNSMQGTTSSLMESSYAQDSHRSSHRSAVNTPKDVDYANSPGSVSNSQRGAYDSSYDRDHHSRSPLRSTHDDHAPANSKDRSSSRPRDPEYRETIYNNPNMDIEFYRATTTKEERRLDRQRERERRDLEKARSERRRDGDKSEGGNDRRSGGSYVSRSRTEREERDRYESSEHFTSNRSRGGDKYEGYDINDHRSERHSVAGGDERMSHSDREKAAQKAREESYPEQYVKKSSSRDAYHDNSPYDDSNAVPYQPGTSVHSGRMHSSTMRDRADSAMSVHSLGGKISLVDIARTHDPNYKSERSSRPSSMSNRRIYEDDLNSRYNNNSISPLNYPASTVISATTSSHADKMHSKSHSNLVSHSYDERHHHQTSKSNMSVGYTSDRHSVNRRSSHEPTSVHNTSCNKGDHGNHRSSRDLRESGNYHDQERSQDPVRDRDARAPYEQDYSSQQSYLDDNNTSNSKRHSSRQMDSYSHQPHSTSHKDMTYSDSANYPSNRSSSRPVSLHRSSSNKYESSAYAAKEGGAKHAVHHSAHRTSTNNMPSDDDVTRLSRPIDPQYNAKANNAHSSVPSNVQSNMRSSSTHSMSYNANNQGMYSESNHSTPTAVYANTKPSSTVSMSKPSAHVNSAGTGDSRKKWVCNMCTLENPPDFLACDACGMLRSK